MWSRAAILGAPVTEPPGNMACIAAAHEVPGRRRPSTRETRCSTPAMERADMSSGQRTRARLTDGAQVVALEVHDHDVLGGILGRRAQLGGGAAGTCALDGHGPDEVAATRQEELRRR